MGYMISFSRIPKLVLMVLGFFFLLTAWAVTKPGWRKIEGEGYTLKYPPSWHAETLNKSIGPEKFLLTINNTKQTFDSSGYRTESPEILRIVFKRLADRTTLEKTNTQVGGYEAYATAMESSREIYRKEIRYKIKGPEDHLYLLEAYIFEKENPIKAYWYEFLVRAIAYSLNFPQ